MRQLIGAMRRSMLVRAVGSNIAMQVALTIAQLAVVPVFITHWGASGYGVWLMLFAIPSYVTMADIGLASAAGNDMTARVARGDRPGATAIYQAVRLVTFGTGLITVISATLLLFVLAPDLLRGAQHAARGHAAAVALALAGYGAVGLQTSVASAGMRAPGGYALSGYIFAGLLLTEAVVALLLVATGHQMLAVAVAYLLVRVAGVAAMGLALAARASWLVSWRWRSSLRVLRDLLRPAFAVMVLPAALAASFQGTVLAIGFVLGTAAVPAFTAVRTLSRVAIQAILLINHAVMPSLTMAMAVGDGPRVSRYATLSFATSLALAAPGSLVLLFGGQQIVGIWTHHLLAPPFALFAVMAVAMVLNALWQPASNLILAINQHERFTWYYLAVSLTGLLLCLPLVHWLGVVGAGLSLLLVDIAMLWRISGLSRRLGLLHVAAAWEYMVELMQGWRARRAAGGSG